MSTDLSIDPVSGDAKTSGLETSDVLSSSGQSPQPPPATLRGLGRLFAQLIGQLVRAIFYTLMLPLRLYLSLRRSMTVASVSLLLTTFMTLNVIWGFPWSGMMGACLALLGIGFVINRVMGPRLKLSVALPRSAPAGHPFSVEVRVTNRRVLPALNLRLGWHREGVREIYRDRDSIHWDASPPISVDLLRSDDQMQWHGAMRFDRRGIHQLPPFQVSSTFPFHLFHYRNGIETDTQIAITPAPASGDEANTRVLLAALGDWSAQLVAGAPVEYIGNREYEVGVPVRRWDFASWARLGRPIVREYQAPSVQAVTLIIDTSQVSVSQVAVSRSEQKRLQRETERAFEKLLSIAATAVTTIASRRVQLNLYLTCEKSSEIRSGRTNAIAGEGNESMLVRLAAAKPIPPSLGERRLLEAIELNYRQPILTFSLLDLDGDDRSKLVGKLPANVTYLSIKSDSDHEATS